VLPGYVQREFEDNLKCGRLEHGFQRQRAAESGLLDYVIFGRNDPPASLPQYLRQALGLEPLELLERI